MRDQFDVDLEDLLSEVEMTTNLMVAASLCDERLSLQHVDHVLGVVRRGDDPVESNDTEPGPV